MSGLAGRRVEDGMGVRTSVCRTMAFAAVFVGAVYAGRLTVMDRTNLSLIWPAAGVAVLWFCLQRGSPWRWLDAVALAVATVVVNMATGASFVLAMAFVAANLAQVVVFVAVLGRFAPDLWGAGGTRVLSRTADLWKLLVSAVVATAAGAAIGPTASWLLGGQYSVAATAVWLARNTASVLVIGAAGLRVAALLAGAGARSPAALWGSVVRAVRRAGRWRLVEHVALVAVSVFAYLAGFVIDHGLPLAFPLLAVTVWAGLRMSTTFVVLHDLTVSATAVLFTLHGNGPFAQIPSHPVRALIAQLFVLMIAVIGLALALGRDERDALLHQLADRQRQAADQARLLGTIIESMRDGLAVFSRDGRVVMHNQAAETLLGGHVSPPDRLTDPARYGLFHPDGRPLAAADMAHAQALGGSGPADMDIVIRDPDMPAGRTMSVHASPLPADEQGVRGAVVLFHDVTADRRHRDELAAFAAVVAHDLLNPLAVIDGWTETTTELLAGQPEDPTAAEARAGLARVTRAADRMRALITGLFDYTAARDAVLRPARLSLAEIVTDIAALRTDLALATGSPTPTFLVGDLHDVIADPVLTRQLVDNLIGNAIKYTAPGITPTVAISSNRTRDQMIIVQVRDNGIGIPPGQHQAIFDHFHRAHRGAEIPGHGLGLAICQRIVHRHGGTITATDNPDGGTTFTLTLPAAAAPTPLDSSTRHAVV